MGRILIAGLLGAVVLFVWGFVSWMFVGWHEATLSKLPDETVVLTYLREQVPEPGVYVFPYMPEDMSDDAAVAANEALHKQGPVGLLSVGPGGDAMPPTMMATGFGINLIVSLIAAWAAGAGKSVAAVVHPARRVYRDAGAAGRDHG